MPASYGGSGGSSGPTTPALALLDAGNPDTFVTLNGSGVGAPLPSDDARAAMEAAAIPTAGLDAARPAAAVAILGALYSATDTGVRYLCESDGAGGARWVVSGARGQEGRDTTAVLLGGTVYATVGTTIDTATISSYALVFAMRSAPADTRTFAWMDDSNPGAMGLLEIGRDAGDRYLLGVSRQGSWTAQRMLTGATVSASPTTLHCIAITWDGQLTRYSLDGAAVATVDHGAGSQTNATLPLILGATFAGTLTPDAWLGEVVLWSTAVGDSDLAAASGAAKAGGASPGRIPAVSGATEILRTHPGWLRSGIVTEPLLKGSLAGTMTWSAAPTLVIR